MAKQGRFITTDEQFLLLGGLNLFKDTCPKTQVFQADTLQLLQCYRSSNSLAYDNVVKWNYNLPCVVGDLQQYLNFKPGDGIIISSPGVTSLGKKQVVPYEFIDHEVKPSLSHRVSVLFSSITTPSRNNVTVAPEPSSQVTAALEQSHRQPSPTSTTINETSRRGYNSIQPSSTVPTVLFTSPAPVLSPIIATNGQSHVVVTSNPGTDLRNDNGLVAGFRNFKALGVTARRISGTSS